MFYRTRHLGQDNLDKTTSERTAMARKPGKDSSERITGTVWTGRIASVYTRQRGQPGHDSGARTSRTVSLDWLAWKVSPDMSDWTEKERTGQQKHDIKDLTARTDHPRETANTGQIYGTVRA
jgi:hypothetical protein